MSGQQIMLSFLLGSAALGTGSAHAAERPDLAVTVVVHDYAQTPASVLGEARQTAERVFKQAGVRFAWEAPQARPRKATDLFLRLVPERMIASYGLNRKDLAFSLAAGDGSTGCLAGIIVDRVEAVADRERSPLAVVLGHIIAHELGHLLLGTKTHAEAGIMKFPVDRSYLARAEKGELLFTRHQAKRIRENVRRRLKREDTRSKAT